MSKIIHFYDKTSISVTDEQADMVQRGINAGGEWVTIRGDFYKVSNIAKIKTAGTTPGMSSKRPQLPDLSEGMDPKMQAAYDKRTISLNERKRLGGGNE